MLTAGIDVGSRTTKVVILENGKWLEEKIKNTGANSIKRAEEVFDSALNDLNLKKGDIDYIIATGYGRVNISFADEKITEITCHGLGAHRLFPNTKTIIDIGGQDSKVISLDDKGRVDDFVMNDKCAAGTGRFLEVMADNLEVPLKKIGELSLKTKKAADISSTCTVFAESEVISLVAEGIKKSKILRGLHKSIVKRMIGMILKVGLNKEITMTGGVCHNDGVYEILEKELNLKINRPAKPQYVGAYGAANLAYRKLRKI
ncbi:MAG: acyl-CoA dehydratase activase [Bacillota bacterium]